MATSVAEEAHTSWEDPNVHHLPQSTIYFNSFLAGGFALATSFAIMHPLDTLKTQMQAAAGSGISGTQSSLKIGSIFSLQTFQTLKRGFTASVLGAAPQGALRWMSYEITKHELNKSLFGVTNNVHTMKKPTNNISPLPSPLFMAISAVSAIVGDTASSVVKVPREVITARLQTGFYEKRGDGKLSGIQVFFKIIKEEGVQGLFRGFSSTTARDWPFMAILFVCYDSFKAAHWHYTFSKISTEDLNSGNIPEYTITTLRSILFGGISGALAAFTTTPFDVIKTKVMTNTSVSYQKDNTGKVKRASILDIAKLLIKEQQQVLQHSNKSVNTFNLSKVFFTGATARSTWWFFVCSMFFPIYERAKEKLDSRSEKALRDKLMYK